MTNKTYSELLLDPRWQRKRLEILQRSNFSCETCEAIDKTLHVHHKKYRKGAKPWEYENDELESLCKDCHDYHHQIKKRLDIAIGLLGPRMDEVLGFAEGLLVADCHLQPATIVITSYEYAQGFYFGILAPPQPLKIYDLIASVPGMQVEK